MSLENMMNPKPPSPPPRDGQQFDDVLRESAPKVPLRSWRKKYRKMKVRFDKAMEESNTLFKDLHKLDLLARRLQEQNDQHVEILLDLNEILPKYELGEPDKDVQPGGGADADAPKSLASLMRIPHTEPSNDATRYPPELRGDSPPGYMTAEYEEEYLTNMDVHLEAQPDIDSLDDDIAFPPVPRTRVLPPEKELLNANPMSVISWLRNNHPETFIQEKEAAEKGSKSKASGKRSSMATVTSVAGTGTPKPKDEGEEVEEWPVEEKTSGRAKKSKDDEAYRPKGGSSRPAKRKREDGEKGGRSKKAKAAGGAASTPG